MAFEMYGRVCVGGVLTPEALVQANGAFLTGLALSADAPADQVFQRLRDDTPRHKLHEPDRVRYERAFEAYIDARWNADCAIGGVSPDGLLDVRRGYVFVGVRVEQFELVIPAAGTGATVPDRPQWLHKGDLSAGSTLSRVLGPDARKPWEHAGRSYQRAHKEIMKDAMDRTRMLPVSSQHDIDWALCRWLVEDTHSSVQHRHGHAR